MWHVGIFECQPHGILIRLLRLRIANSRIRFLMCYVLAVLSSSF
jgi:hypothetical protein